MWGATLGIVGLGRIGRAVARRALGFDMRMDEVFAQSGFVTLHLPAMPETEPVPTSMPGRPSR
jgi:phosphoglycerate dehydrogenase-like enzyme